MQSLALVTLLVHDYGQAVEWFTHKLQFSVVEDTELTPGKRWVVLSSGGSGAMLLLAKAADAAQAASVGKQAGGRVGFFLNTDDFDSSHARMRAEGVSFIEEPRTESYGKVAVFEDLCGNRWDLIQHFR